jgi:hypothetical protein
MTSDPCPYCGMPGIALARVDFKTEEIVRDIKDHSCPEWAPKTMLTRMSTDTGFIGAGRNTAEGLADWRRSIRKRGIG